MGSTDPFQRFKNFLSTEKPQLRQEPIPKTTEETGETELGNMQSAPKEEILPTPPETLEKETVEEKPEETKQQDGVKVDKSSKKRQRLVHHFGQKAEHTEYEPETKPENGAATVLYFAEIFPEPPAYRAFPCSSLIVRVVFDEVRTFIYRLLAFILGIPLVIIWAALFACFISCHVWVCVPFGRLLSIPGAWIRSVWSFLVRGILDPLFVACGAGLSKYRREKLPAFDRYYQTV